MKCKDCKWWEQDDEDIGECRRFPPVLMYGMLEKLQDISPIDAHTIDDGMWVYTKGDKWCGEFQPKKIKPSPGAHA